MGGSWSEEVYTLLERAGEHRTRTPTSHAAWFLCFQNRKWLLRPSHAGRYLWATIRDGGARNWLRTVRWLLGIRLIRLYSEGCLRWRWAKVRDKEQKKISFFDPVGNRKRVYWADKRDFDRELSIQQHFATHGVSTVPFETCDQPRLLAEQPLIGTMFRHAASLSPIDAQLLDYVVNTASVHRVAEYVARVALMAGSRGPEAEAFGLATARLRRLAPLEALQFPMALMHGDLSRQNIVWNEDGDAFLIDFDRSFEASAYYDFVYAGLSPNGFGPEQLETSRNYVVAINERLMPETVVSRDDALEFALALFVVDNIVYLNQQHVGTSSKAFTRKVMSRALRGLVNPHHTRATEHEVGPVTEDAAI